MARIGREGQGSRGQPAARLRSAVPDVIGRRLRLHYEELQQQPLPERLADLLQELDRREDDPPPRRR